MLDPDFTLDVELARRVNRILFRYTQSTAQLEDGTWRGPVGGILSDDCTTLEFTCGREFPQMGMCTFKFEKNGKESWVETVKHALRHWPDFYVRIKFTGDAEPYTPVDIVESRRP